MDNYTRMDIWMNTSSVLWSQRKKNRLFFHIIYSCNISYVHSPRKRDCLKKWTVLEHLHLLLIPNTRIKTSSYTAFRDSKVSIGKRFLICAQVKPEVSTVQLFHSNCLFATDSWCVPLPRFARVSLSKSWNAVQLFSATRKISQLISSKTVLAIPRFAVLIHSTVSRDIFFYRF